MPFTTQMGTSYLTGRVDLVYEDNGGYVVVDYKSDEVTTDVDAVKAHAMEQHSGQAEIYAEALSAALGRPVSKVVFVFARVGVDVSMTVECPR